MTLPRITSIVRDRRVTARNHAVIMRRLLLAEMFRHLRETIPKHFQAGAQNVYHYKARTLKYQRYKLKKKGHNRPLVWSGRTEREIQTGALITANQYRSILSYKNYFPLTKADTKERKEEIQKINQGELITIYRRLKKGYAFQVRLPQNRTQRMRRS